ncbi:MAG: dTMP kinase [Thiotrichales bacterium]|nr:dTMP kinase [Thiotrichales bacterium]
MTRTKPDRGRFLSIEGVDGAGKSTQLPRIERWLQSVGTRTLATREPGGTPLGESLRTMLLDPRFTGMSPMAELLAVFAARAEHLAKVIAPAIEDGVWVLCERFTDATFAYQGGGRDVDRTTIAALQDIVQSDIRPDLVLVLDLPPAVGLARAERRRHGAVSVQGTAAGSGAADRFEREDAAFFRRVREIYLERARENPERYAVIDASNDGATVTEHLIRAIEERLP